MTRPAEDVCGSVAGRVGRVVGERLPDTPIFTDSQRQLQVVQLQTEVTRVAGSWGGRRFSAKTFKGRAPSPASSRCLKLSFRPITTFTAIDLEQ